MAGYIGSKAVSVNTTSATISDDLTVGDDATIAGDLDVAGTLKIVDTELAEASDNFSINIQTGNNDFYVKSGGTIFAAFKGSPKDLQLTSGNLVIGTAGKGIDFSATSDGAGTDTSELLDDYEEGTWTPAFTAITSPTYSHQYGYYTKVGRKVTFHMTLIWSAGTSIGRNIGGLPYAVGNVTEYYFMSSTYHSTGTTYPSGRTTFVAYPVINASNIETACNGSNIAAAAATFGTAGDLYITGFYYIN